MEQNLDTKCGKHWSDKHRHNSNFAANRGPVISLLLYVANFVFGHFYIKLWKIVPTFPNEQTQIEAFKIHALFGDKNCSRLNGRIIVKNRSAAIVPKSGKLIHRNKGL